MIVETTTRSRTIPAQPALRADAMLRCQCLDGIFRLLETSPGLFAVEFDSQDFLLVSHEGEDLALKAGRIDTKYFHRFATSSGEWSSRSQRFDGILGLFESTSGLLAVEFDGSNLLVLLHEQENLVFKAAGLLGNTFFGVSLRLLASQWRGYDLFYP